MPKKGYTTADISDEEYREICFMSTGRVYRIDNPVELVRRVGGMTHRVIDAKGLVHCYPAPEATGLTVIRWKNKPGTDPVKF